MKSIAELRAQAQKIASDPDSVYDMTGEDVASLRKYLHPMGNVVTGSKCFVNMGIINWKDKYLRRLHMTSMIGYLYRTLEEYEPTAELLADLLKFPKCRGARAPNTPNTPNTTTCPECKTVCEPAYAARVKLVTDTVRGIVRNFLNRNFEYNPDKHLRAATADRTESPEERKMHILSATNTASGATRMENVIRSKPDAMFHCLRNQTLSLSTAAQATTAALKSVLTTLSGTGQEDGAISSEDAHGILLKQYAKLRELAADIQTITEPLQAADSLAAWKANPPTELFHQYDRYLSNHYEQLQEIVEAYYNEKNDFEFSVIVHDAFKTEAEAKQYRIQHEAEFRTEVFTIENNAVTMLGPFKENRERVDFYNKNTEIMKRMMEQSESDHKVGAALMAKQVKEQKRKNIAEMGPDAPGLANYVKAAGTVAELGAKKVLTKEEMDELAKATLVKEDFEVPDNAIQVDMFFPEEVDGETVLKRKKFYTESEAPPSMDDLMHIGPNVPKLSK